MTAHPIRLLSAWPDDFGRAICDSDPLDRARFDPAGALAIDEARALSSLDEVLLPDDGALEAGSAMGELPLRAFTLRSASDDLRLPPPPVRAIDGEGIFRALSKVVAARGDPKASQHLLPALEPVDAPESDPEERMISLLRGLLDLETEIRERAFRCRRA